MLNATDWLGYAGAVAVGLALGLTGGGGSILTVPIMVYLMGVSPVTATAYSLFVVGATALAGSVRFVRRGLVSCRAVAVYGLPSLVAVYLTRRLLLPALPDPLVRWGGATVSKEGAILLLFAVVMVVAAVAMLRDHHALPPTGRASGGKGFVLAARALGVGVITGLVGAGGGFLIVPALVVLGGLPMKVAVGTSLVIIAVSALPGFLGDLGRLPINWPLLLTFTGLAVAGVVAGSYGARWVPEAQLKKGFGWFVLATGGTMLARELLR